jgi:CDP-glucose 4,6-dehydratase
MQVMGFDWENRKVLVTGASGFKGAWLSAALLRLGAKVYAVVRSKRNPLSAAEVFGLGEQLVEVTLDICDRQAVYDVMNSVQPDVVFHLAAKALVPVSIRDPHRTFDVNVMGTLNILEACRVLSVCNRLLVCSTDHVFGNVAPEQMPEHGFDEHSPVNYSGPYDTSKAAMELMVRCYHHTFGGKLPAIGITRCANVFGFGDTNERRLLPVLVRHALSKGVVPLNYGKTGRQFIHVTDAIAGYIRAASSLNAEAGSSEGVGQQLPDGRASFGPTFHFAIEAYAGTAEPFIRLEHLANQVADQFSVPVLKDAVWMDYSPNENRSQALNCSVTRKHLRWEARKPFLPAIRDLGRWYSAARSDELKDMIQADLSETIRALDIQTREA